MRPSGVCKGREPGVNPPLTIAKKMKPFLILKRTDFSSSGAGRNCYHVFLFCPTFQFNLEKLSLRCVGCDTQQYRQSSFSDVFCLNCIFVIDAAVKQLVSRSFPKRGVSAVAMAAHISFLIKSNLHCTRFITLAVVPKRGSEWWGTTPRLSAWATQVQRNVTAAASHWLHYVRFDRPGNRTPNLSRG